jgi:hypothetical protein
MCRVAKKVMHSVCVGCFIQYKAGTVSGDAQSPPYLSIQILPSSCFQNIRGTSLFLNYIVIFDSSKMLNYL